tara:strand:- start:38 stop:892 length:855 start_codon:yes stop_codon:yes gene_type:complete
MLRLVGNIIWFIGGGFVLGLGWWFFGILMYVLVFTIPWAKSCFIIGQFCFFPFGKEVISRKKLTGDDDVGTGGLGLAGNIVWVIFAGIWLFFGHILSGIVCCITIIGIPFGIQHFKIAGASFAPIGMIVVDKGVAKEAIKANAKEEFENIRNKKKPSKIQGQNKTYSKPSHLGGSVPADIQKMATFWKAHLIKNPEDYGGWVKYIYWWGIIPYIGIIIGIIGLTRNNIIKNAQAKGLIFISLLVFLLFFEKWHGDPDTFNTKDMKNTEKKVITDSEGKLVIVDK